MNIDKKSLEKPVFSIIIPVYKTETYLEKCVSSILQQSYENFEVILVDDGSPDRCPEICDYYRQKDSRVRVFHKQNGGVSSARNVGIAMAKGEYIWFVDSDDYIGENSLQQIFNIQQNHSADLYIFNTSNIQEKFTGNIDAFFEKYYFTYILGFELWNKLYKRSILHLFNIEFDIQETVGEDLLFNIEYYKGLFDSNGKICLSPEKGYYNYIDRTDSAMHSYSKNRLNQQLRLFDKIERKMSEYLSDKSLIYLFFLHLLSGIGQASKAKLNSLEFSHLNFLKYAQWIDNFREIEDMFFYNEGASSLGKLRLKVFVKALQQKKYRLAGKVMGLQ